VWDYITDSEGLLSGMEQVAEAYEESPLLRVGINFVVEENGGKLYLKTPEGVGGGGNLIPMKLDSECVQEYLQSIGRAAEDYTRRTVGVS